MTEIGIGIAVVLVIAGLFIWLVKSGTAKSKKIAELQEINRQQEAYNVLLKQNAKIDGAKLSDDELESIR